MALKGSHEVIVVGGGIAGLTAAWELRDRDLLLLEAETRVGGRIKSEPRGEYWLNMGAHLFGGPDTVSGRLVQELGLESREIPGSRMGLAVGGRVLASGAAETYPFRLPLSLGARLSFMRAGLKLRRAARDYLRATRPRPGESAPERRTRLLAYRGDQSFAQFLGPVHPDVDAIFRAIIGRVAATPEELAAGYGAALFSMVWGGEDQLARNLVGGSACLTEAMNRRLGNRVMTGAAVEEVATTTNGRRVRFTVAGQAHEASAANVVMATPAHVTRRIVRDLPAETAAALDRIAYGPFVCASILTAETGRMPWDEVYAIVVAGRSFNMFYNHANVLREPGRRRPGGSLMVFAGGALGHRLLDITDDQVRETMLGDLQDLYPEVRGIVREVVITRWPQGLAYARPGRHSIQAALEKPLGNLFLAGDYLDWAHMEAAAQSGHDAAVKVRERLRGAPPRAPPRTTKGLAGSG